MKTIFTLITLLIVASSSNAQTIRDSTYTPTKKYVKTLKLNVENGAILSNGSEFAEELVEAAYYNGIDVRLGFRATDAYNTYSTVYRRPTLGVGYYASTFKNENVGTPMAVYFFLEMPFKFQEEKKLTYSYTAAFGLSYNFSPYDSISNPTNLLIGSYKNCYVHLGFSANYALNDKWNLNGTVGFKHFSNGAIKKPNSGLNLLPVSIGATYKITDDEIHEYKTPLPAYKRHNLYNLTMAAGSKNYAIGEPNYLKVGIGFNYLRQINYRYRIGVGLDAFYAGKSELRSSNGQGGFQESFSLALVGSWEWMITERLYAPIGLAYYIHRNVENDEKQNYYERVGLRYKITDHLCAGITIKAHGGSADIFEWTIGYTFHNDPNKYR